MTELALPPSLCLVRASADIAAKTACTVVGCVPVTQACVDQGSCVEVVDGEEPHYIVIFLRAPGGLPAPFAETYTLARYLCTLHQERTLIDGVLRGRSWLTTIEGTEFESAFTFWRLAYPAEAERWAPRLSDVDNYADVCADWYYPYARDPSVADELPLREFAEKWLPK